MDLYNSAGQDSSRGAIGLTGQMAWLKLTRVALPPLIPGHARLLAKLPASNSRIPPHGVTRNQTPRSDGK